MFQEMLAITNGGGTNVVPYKTGTFTATNGVVTVNEDMTDVKYIVFNQINTPLYSMATVIKKGDIINYEFWNNPPLAQVYSELGLQSFTDTTFVYKWNTNNINFKYYLFKEIS